MKKTIVLLSMLLMTALAQAVPVLINYQGTYLDNAGVPVTQSGTPVVISIWDDATSTNTANRKYQESHTVNIDDGVFSLKIGSGGTPVGTFNALLFDTASSLYLQLTINGEVMLPRARFLSAPYTLQSDNSAKLGNQLPSYFASAADLNSLASTVGALSAMEERLCKATWGSRWVSSLPLCVGGSVDISNADLTSIDLSGLRLDGADTTKTHFDNTDLSRAYLRNLLFGAGTPPLFPYSNLSNATMTDFISMDGMNLNHINPTGLYSNALGSCPDSLPEDWYCVSSVSNANTNVPPYRLIGPGARFSDDPDLPAATWIDTEFPTKLMGVNFKGNVFRNCKFASDTNFKDANLLGAKIINCDHGAITWNNTICPDGSNSNMNDNTCIGFGF